MSTHISSQQAKRNALKLSCVGAVTVCGPCGGEAEYSFMATRVQDPCIVKLLVGNV